MKKPLDLKLALEIRKASGRKEKEKIMREKSTQKYCADGQAIAAMKRDGIGWGHDLESGCFEAPVTPRRGFLGQGLITMMKGL